MNRCEFWCWVGLSSVLTRFEFRRWFGLSSVLNRVEFRCWIGGLLVGLGVGLVSGGGEWRKAFFLDLLFVVNGDGEYFFVVVSVVVVAWWVAVPIWVYSFFFWGLLGTDIWSVVWSLCLWVGCAFGGLVWVFGWFRGFGGWRVAMGEEVLGRIERWERREKREK